MLELLNKHQESLCPLNQRLDSQTLNSENQRDLTETNKPQNGNNTQSKGMSKKSRVDNGKDSVVVLGKGGNLELGGGKLELGGRSSKNTEKSVKNIENRTENGLKRRLSEKTCFSLVIPDEAQEISGAKHCKSDQVSVNPHKEPHKEILSDEQSETYQIMKHELTKTQNAKPENSNSAETQFHCLVCSVFFNSQKEYRLHYNSIQHKSSIDGFRRPETGKSHGLPPVYHCKTCSLDFANPSSLNRHFGSKCHRDVFFGVTKRKNEKNMRECLSVRTPPEPRKKLPVDNDNGPKNEATRSQVMKKMDTKQKPMQTENYHPHIKVEIYPASNEDLRQQVLSHQLHTPTISESGSGHNFSSNPVKLLKDTSFSTITQQLVRQPHTSTPHTSIPNLSPQMPPVSNETIHANHFLTNLALMQLLNPQLTNNGTFGQHLQNLNFRSAQQVQQALLIRQLQSVQNIHNNVPNNAQNKIQGQNNLEEHPQQFSFQQTVDFLSRNPQFQDSMNSKVPKTTRAVRAYKP